PANIIAVCSSDAVRQKLAIFTSIIESHQNSSFQQFYNAVVSYEQSIITSDTLTAGDKEKLLITSSIARYGYNKMLDGGGLTGAWKRFNTSVYASITGAETNMATAITLSVRAGIASGN